MKSIYIALILFSTSSFAQFQVNKDSLLQLLERIERPVPRESATEGELKCGFPIEAQILANIDKYTPDQIQLINSLFQRVPRTNTLVSPSGKFRIQYNASGTEAPRYVSNLTAEQNAMLVAEAADSAYNFEVNYLGYLPPPPDNGKGGDNLYDIYIRDLNGSGIYGQTTFEDEVTPGSGKFTSFMEVDNDYAGYFSTGINGLRVTVAHELHHGIQGGRYIFRSSDAYYYELSSTAMEEFVYDTVNDYYGYMSSYFQNTYMALNAQNGYNVAIFNLFLQKQFDHNLLRRIWELIPADVALNAINAALLERGSSFTAEYSTFGLWTYFTKYRSEDRFFEEGANYPLVRPLQVITFSPPEDSVYASVKPTGNGYLFFVQGIDTLVSVISNSDISTALATPLSDQYFSYNLYNYENPGSIKLTDNFFMKFSAQKPNFWQTTEILNNLIIKEGLVNEVTADFPFPTPFYYKRSYQTGSSIFIPVSDATTGTVELEVYSMGMTEVYSNSFQPIISKVGSSRFRGVEWDLSTQDKLATGVYIYIVKSGDNVKKGKLLIFND